MSLTAREDVSFTPAPEGTHSAVCIAVIDLGTQHSDRWGKSQHKVLLGWLLDTDEKRDDGEPFTIWRRYTVSLHEKAGLRKSLEAWRGRKFTKEELEGFDLASILGKPCLLSLTHNTVEGTTYANIAGISGLPKGMSGPTPPSKLTLFNIDEPDMDVFNAFSEKLRKEIEKSAEWGATTDEPARDGELGPNLADDDIPF